MEKNYIKVSALNNYIKLLLDDNSFLHKVYLKGEISNFKNHMSGHLYFTLKDEESRISAIMFRNKTIDLKFTPEDGKKVLVEGRVSSYPSQGTYQVYVDKMEEDGLGNLYVLYEELKNRLQKEGLFDGSHKKEIPKYPSRIGIVTASTGAAIKDILSTIKRRYPIVETILFPALVQGKGAASDIVKQINKAQEYDLDVLIVGRGGGSIEDLWAFNEEIVARAIFASKVPVISAVGHEIDYTISDFVADLRAPTPTGAAEMAVPTMQEVVRLLSHFKVNLNHLIQKKLEISNKHLETCRSSYLLKNPGTLLDVKVQKLDFVNEKLNQLMKQYLADQQNIFSKLVSSYVLKDPLMIYRNKENMILSFQKQGSYLMKQILEKKSYELSNITNTVKLVNPLNILEKGYSIVKMEDKVITSSEEVHPDDLISIKMKKGSILASVKEVN